MTQAHGPIKTTIRLTVVAAFILATLFTAALALGLQYYFSENMARRAATELYATTASGVAAELTGMGRVYTNLIKLLSDNQELAKTDNTAELLRIFTNVLNESPLLYGAYIGRNEGSLLEVISLKNARETGQDLGGPAAAQWLLMAIEKTDGVTRRSFSYLDSELTTIASNVKETDYNVTERPWYQSALLSSDLHVSSSYPFAQSGAWGRTTSRRVRDSQTVVGLDITLSSLSQFLSRQTVARNSDIYLFDKKGQIVASNQPSQSLKAGTATDIESAPATARTPSQISPQLLTIGLNSVSHDKLVAVAINNEHHLFYTSPVSSGANSLFLGILTPVSAVMAPFTEKIILSMAITAGALLLLIPLSWWFANPIVRPIKELALENDKVRQRQFEQVKRVSSRVRELDDLSASMVSMSDSIQAHEQAQRELIDAVIRLIAQAIDDKSAYTSGHCERVPELALMLAKAANQSTEPAFLDFHLETEDQWREYSIAAWLHDCGKITTPEHIVDKGSKLETIYNRIHEVRMRFEVLSRDAEVAYWEKLSLNPDQREDLIRELKTEQDQLQEDFEFIAQCNIGGEYLDESRVHRLKMIAERTWQRRFDDQAGLSPVEELRQNGGKVHLPTTEKLLADKPQHIIERSHPSQFAPELGINMDVPEHLYNLGELYNLSVSKGTLTTEDRFKINEHMISTIKMLENLPFPDELKNVPRYASTHHETMKGSGYPRRLSGEELSIPERILAVADIFEALTASDRPYKKAKPVSVAIDILYKMAQDNHIDRDCFELFLTAGVYQRYASQYLDPDQLDKVDVAQYLRGTAQQANSV